MPPAQNKRLLAIGTALAADKLLLEQFTFSDRLGRLFQIEAELSSEDPAIKFDDVVGTNATIRLELPEKKTRYFNGFISRFMQTAQEGNTARYRATLVPWLWFLTRTADCRIFQKKKVPDIIEEVFKAHGFSDYKLSLSGTYDEWEYCVQYRETDFNFVSRLMEQEGIYYFFTHDNGKHTLVLADAAAAHSPFGDYSTISFQPANHPGGETQEMITEWIIEQEVQTGAYVVADFNFNTPGSPILGNANISRSHSASHFEIFDYPGEFEKRDEGDAYAKLRIQELQADHEILRGQASSRGIATGCKFTLKGHPRSDQNREYLVTGVSCRAGVSEFESTEPGSEGEFFSCSFTAMPASEPFRAARLTPKPVIQGPQTAMVVGKSGEEIDTDEFGRVKVQFHWDRYGKVDENSSCFVRVSHAAAGKGWGAISIPRIGQEVIVEFLEGDPDRPIITGRVYNATAKVPYALPDNKTMSTFKSNSSKGGQGFNEIRFEDKKGSEQLFIHAEKDRELRVKNDTKEWVGNNRHSIIKKDDMELVEGAQHLHVKGNKLSKVEGDDNLLVKGNQHQEVDGDQHVTIKGNQNSKVSGDHNLEVTGADNQKIDGDVSLKAGGQIQIKAGKNYAVDAGMNVHIKGGTVVVVEAGTQLSLKAGPSFVDIGPSGVSISGPMVNLNSGGAAGSGSGSSPTAPAAPDPPDPPTDPQEAAKVDPGQKDDAPAAPTPPQPVTYSAAATVLQQSAQDGTPFCEECKREQEKEEEDEELAVITSIAWLDGADDKEIADGIQWVNLPQEDKWVDKDRGIVSKDRLSQKPRFKVKFSKPGGHSFKVKAEAGDDNLQYTDTEKGRNSNFKWQDQEKSFTTDGDGTKIVSGDFFTTCGGGDKFKLVAEDTNNNPSVETGWLETRRVAYLVPIKMTGMASIAELSAFKSEFSDRGIELIELPAAEIARMANISTDDEDTFKNRCKTAFNGSQGKAKSPYAVAAAFTEHLAVKNPNQALELAGVAVGPDADPAVIPVAARGLRAGDGLNTRYLWKELVPGEGWFVSAEFVPDGGGNSVNLAEAKCTPLPEGASACSSVRVDVTGLPAGSGTIKLKVNVVDRMRGGLSFSGGNLICVCTKAWWQEKEAGSQNQTLIHEMGHKVNMVCTGDGKQPDKVVTQYSGKGHVGNHCHFGLPVQDTYSSGPAGTCVMFGSSGAERKSEFCDNCAPAVRKMDLSPGWTA